MTTQSHLCRGVRFGSRSISSSGSASMSLICANPYFSSSASSNVGIATNWTRFPTFVSCCVSPMSQYHICIVVVAGKRAFCCVLFRQTASTYSSQSLKLIIGRFFFDKFMTQPFTLEQAEVFLDTERVWNCFSFFSLFLGSITWSGTGWRLRKVVECLELSRQRSRLGIEGD